MIEQALEQASPKMIALGVVVVFIVFKMVGAITQEVKIRRLGGHAQRVKGSRWAPFGMLRHPTLPLERHLANSR